MRELLAPWAARRLRRASSLLGTISGLLGEVADLVDPPDARASAPSDAEGEVVRMSPAGEAMLFHRPNLDDGDDEVLEPPLRGSLAARAAATRGRA